MDFDLMDKGYRPDELEKKWYSFWENSKLFSSDENPKGKTYSMVIPPPNVTGVLHMGHALNSTLQDILCRYQRLKGNSVLWIPGTDHAGIATQNVVEKRIALDGLSREELGRSEFVELVWDWRKKYGRIIIQQMKRLGISCDWDRERFTMDTGISLAVRKVFVNLYNDGLLYRGNYITNWCPRCRTALSDLEVDYREVKGRMYKIKYPYANGYDHITVATTRPETMLGDVAIAVHPEDPRFGNITTRKVVLPLVNREIPIIRDKYVDRSFGTGALKITPAHDQNDFEIGLRHDLKNIKVIDDDGRMNSNAGNFDGLDRFECREKILMILKEQNFLVGSELHLHNVGHCYRCNTPVEPNLSRQWFVKAKPLARAAIHAVNEGKTRIIPSMWTKTYYNWLNNIKDWCVSRQIWWGHQIPAWTCSECGKLTVTVKEPDECPGCGSFDLIQDSDVLDTWFSSALWPFSSMGWPGNTDLLKHYYPTSVLVTGFDILFFWVARMMMLGLYFMKNVPFRDVYIHALVRDAEGKKMSKSRGNVVDPIKIIDQYGADAFRITLAAFAAQGKDIKMCDKRVKGYRNFVNKLWNAARFSSEYLDKGYSKINDDHLSVVDFWILSRLENVIIKVDLSLKGYRFNDAVECLYKFIWHEFCDWYIESIKSTLNGKLGDVKRKSVQSVLWFILRDVLILLHPFLPFVTEELWHRFPGVSGSIMKSSYPNSVKYVSSLDNNVKSDMDTIMALVTSIRNIRGEMNIAYSIPLHVVLQTGNDRTANLIRENMELIIDLARLSSIDIDSSRRRPEYAATALAGDLIIFVLLKGIVDFSKEKIRLQKKINRITKDLANMSEKLGNEGFLKNAPVHIVDKVKGKYGDLFEKRRRTQEFFDKIKSISRI